MREEIFILEVVIYYEYFKDIVDEILLYDLDVFILFFIGRDMIVVYYVLD